MESTRKLITPPDQPATAQRRKTLARLRDRAAAAVDAGLRLQQRTVPTDDDVLLVSRDELLTLAFDLEAMAHIVLGLTDRRLAGLEEAA